MILGTVIFLAVIYYLANQRHLFSSTIEVKAVFRNVSGLQSGNNVYFTGISVGAVDDIEITSDTSVVVTMSIEKEASKYIKKNAKATIGTSGLMGTKLVTIVPGDIPAPPINDGDFLATVPAVDIDDVLRVLQQTGAKTYTVTQNLAEISERINNGVGVVGKLLTDTVMAQDVQQVIHDLRQVNQVLAEFKEAGRNTNQMAENLQDISNRINEGQGLAGQLIANDTMVIRFKNMLDSLQAAGSRTAIIAEDLSILSGKMRAGEGTAGKLLTDPKTVNNIDSTLVELRQAAIEFQKNMEEIRQGWLFRFIF